ncbi:hypothetical protein [Spiroplasma sp. BIUS-1]|uniref:hypothetical protein n=1 Tax=Spiroplasma sp. BIUS-1 TaxID=216964 RepID=UPI00139887E8|nr:hypothetical protein [Spiroplasma sp. BIUS-1]QHX36505.1 hypothetical protein SBIUS_v1c02520 [Spiroplasma sp. BIUS-1]
MNKTNLSRLIKLNISSIFKNKSLLVNISLIFLSLLVFTIIYSIKANDYIYKKTVIVNLESMISICLFGVLSIIMVGHLLSSNEAKSFQQLEQRYGVKAKFSFFFRIIMMITLTTTLAFVYFLIQTLAISFQDKHQEVLKIICLPKLNLILYNLLILTLTTFVGVILKASLGNILATLFLVSIAVGPFFSFLANEYSQKDNKISETISEQNFKIIIGKEFHDSILKDKIDLYNGNLNLFGDLHTNGFYKNAKNFDSIFKYYDNQYSKSMYFSYYMGQTLNQIVDESKNEPKNVFEFDKNYYEMITTLKSSIIKIGNENYYKLQQIPFYSDPNKEKQKLNLDKTLKDLELTDFGKKYPNILSYVSNNYYSIYNQIDYTFNTTPLFGKNIPFEESKVYSNEYSFYEEYPEFLAISQILNIGLMNSFNTTIFYQTISTNDKYYYLDIRDYNDYYKKIKARQFLNFFNFVSYQNLAFADIKYSKFMIFSEPSLNYIDEVYQINLSSLQNLYKPIEGDTPNNPKWNPMNTKLSIYDKNKVKVKQTGIIVYSYIVEILLTAAFIYIGFIVFKKNQKI